MSSNASFATSTTLLRGHSRANATGAARHRATGPAVTPWSHVNRKVVGAASTCGAVAAMGLALSAAPAHAASTVDPAFAASVVKYPFSDRIYLVTNSGNQWLTPAQWANLGFPTPRVVSSIPGQVVSKDATSSELFVTVATGETRVKLGFADWAAMQYPQYTLSRSGFYQVPNTETIYQQNLDKAPTPISFADWIALGGPTPQVGFDVGTWLYQDTQGQVYEARVGWNRCAQWRYLDFPTWVAQGAKQPNSTIAPWNIACQTEGEKQGQRELPATKIQRLTDGTIVTLPAI